MDIWNIEKDARVPTKRILPCDWCMVGTLVDDMVGFEADVGRCMVTASDETRRATPSSDALTFPNRAMQPRTERSLVANPRHDYHGDRRSDS